MGLLFLFAKITWGIMREEESRIGDGYFPVVRAIVHYSI